MIGSACVSQFLPVAWKHRYWIIKKAVPGDTGIRLVVDLVTDMESDGVLWRFCRLLSRIYFGKAAAAWSQKLL